MFNGVQKKIKDFFSSPAFGIVGASSDRSKYGNKVLRAYIEHNKKIYPVNPRTKSIEGIPAVGDISELPDDVKSLSIITPPAVTEKVVEQAIAKGIKNIWMQPGAESEVAIRACEQHGISVIAKGPCVLVVLGFRG